MKTKRPYLENLQASIRRQNQMEKEDEIKAKEALPFQIPAAGPS